MKLLMSLLQWLRSVPWLDRWLGSLVDRVRTYWFESRNALDTDGAVALATLDLDDAERRSYEPSGWLTVAKVASVVRFSAEDVFIDFGSGKGRIVYLAARYPLKRVVGVELSESLNAIARRNLTVNRAKLRCREVELVTTDVLDYAIPSDVTIAYFYSPFTGRIFEDVIEKLRQVVERRREPPLSIVYQRAVASPEVHRAALACSEYLQSAAWLTPVHALDGRGTVVEIYRSCT